MKIKSLELNCFRNYDSLSMTFSPGTNILYGDNAQGKTNVLEALYVSCTSKSHRCKKDKEMIQFGQEEAHIKTFLEKNGISNRIDIHLKKHKTKGIAVNGLPIRKASELFGIINAVFFSPEDLNMIKNGPGERRRFLDMELCQLSRLYLMNLTSYNRVLSQRNRLLKDLLGKPDTFDTLDIWDMQLVKYGTEVIKERKKFVSDLQKIIKPIHENLTGGKESLSIFYEPDIQEKEFEEGMKKGRERDIRQKMTLTGPHRDDLEFLVNGMDIRKFGSQGQQRTAALSLKLAEIEIVKRIVHDNPVLFLDDVLSELDKNRQLHLLKSIEGIQTMITCTGLDDFVENRFQMDKIYEVKSGTVVCKNDIGGIT